MPNKLFVLSDQRIHAVYENQSRQLCELAPLPPGHYLVLATGDLMGISIQFQLQLEVFPLFGDAAIARGDAFFSASGASSEVTSDAFSLTVPASVPFEGGAGSGPAPPPPRASISVRWVGGSGYGTVRDITIAAMEVEELVQTTIPLPPGVAVSDTAAAALLRMREAVPRIAAREEDSPRPSSPPTKTTTT
jgi:hypothetical protein